MSPTSNDSERKLGRKVQKWTWKRLGNVDAGEAVSKACTAAKHERRAANKELINRVPQASLVNSAEEE